jgi:hypothetical protein
MTNDNQPILENVGEKKVAKTKFNIAHRYAKFNAKTPQRILNEQVPNNEDPICFLIEDVFNSIELYGNHCQRSFIEERRGYLTSAEKKLSELAAYPSDGSVSGLFEKFGKPASQLIRVMEENQKPILCLDEATVNHAFALIYARTQSSLLNKHWKELPDGEALLLEADNHLEELCSRLKIGRRSRATINKKKANEVV